MKSESHPRVITYNATPTSADYIDKRLCVKTPTTLIIITIVYIYFIDSLRYMAVGMYTDKIII